MLTTNRAFSTICFELEDSLFSKLDKLVDSEILEFYCFISHVPEDGETWRHIHLYCEPRREIDLIFFRCFTDCVSISLYSNFSNWYLYCKHDNTYLDSIGQIRHFHYKDMDFRYNDESIFEDLKRKIDNK